jgi:hypothetical protein
MLPIILAIGCGFAAGLCVAVAEQRRHIDTLRAHYQQVMSHLTGEDDRDDDEAEFWKFKNRN